MFTGIIEKTAKIKRKKDKNDILFLTFELPRNFKIKKGSSVAINGICSTVTSFSQNEFEVGYMKETQRKTSVNLWNIGELVNLEGSLKVGDTLDGHFVYGHIDHGAFITKIANEGDSRTIEFALPSGFLTYIVPKGSVAVDGVSLTVSKKTKKGFAVSLIPYTLNHTNLSLRKVSDMVNVELDVLGKYVLENQNLKIKNQK